MGANVGRGVGLTVGLLVSPGRVGLDEIGDADGILDGKLVGMLVGRLDG